MSDAYLSDLTRRLGHAPTRDDYFAELGLLTGMSPDEWIDFTMLTPEQQLSTAQTYKDAHWVRTKDLLPKVLAVLGLIASIAGVLGGVAGAVVGAAGAVAAIRTLAA